jgi:hypothetical protein
MDVIAEGHGLLEEEWTRKEDMSKELEKTLLFEEVSWRQKSRAIWLWEVIIIQFFHKVTNSNEEIIKWNILSSTYQCHLTLLR